ncbi:MAG TPA: energy transducer TonB [Lacunisphaera sp.]|nr:energy transducer TonB [Lacunisphaera sp.]
MNPSPRRPTRPGLRPWAPAALGLALAAAPLTAQNRLYVEGPDRNFHAVVKVTGGQPYVLENGRATPVDGDRFALRKVDEYLPVFVRVTDQAQSSSAQQLASTDDYHNNELRYRAKFESADALDDVFLALELEIANVGKRIFVSAIGRLEPRTPKLVEVVAPLGHYLGANGLVLHVFAGGGEVLQSEMPESYREAQLDHLVANRVAGVKAAAPRPLFGTMPEYPEALRSSGLKGQAVVTLTINVAGKVIDPVVSRASEPPFGAEALAAVRNWRFVPRVVDGRPVDTRVSIPIDFDAPPAPNR